MANNSTSIPVEEQLKNAKALISMVENQPIVRETMRAYAIQNLIGHQRMGATEVQVFQKVGGPSTPTGKAVESALARLQGTFSYVDIINSLDEKGIPLKVKNRRTAVGSVLRNLRRREIIREVKKGVAGQPSYFERLSRS